MLLKKIFTASASVTFVIMTILNYRVVQAAAKEAVSLCLYSVVPSIFPFMILSFIITKSGGGKSVGKPFAFLFKKLFGVGESCAAAIILGLTAGFPIGAVCCHGLYKSGEISKEDAEYLLSFCSNSGISFIFGVLGGSVFGNIKIGLLIFLIQTASSFLVGILLKKRRKTPFVPQTENENNIAFSELITGAVKSAVVNLAYICGYIIFFAILTQILLVYLPQSFAFGLKSVFELTGAAYKLKLFPQKTAFVLACGLLSWSGICVHMQVRSVTEGLSLKPYFIGKLIHMASSMLMSSLIPLNEYIGTYRENITVTYRNGCFGLIFFIIIIIIISCIFTNNVVK